MFREDEIAKHAVGARSENHGRFRLEYVTRPGPSEVRCLLRMVSTTLATFATNVGSEWEAHERSALRPDHILQAVGVQVQDWFVQVQLHAWLEAVDGHMAVGMPGLEGTLIAESHQLVALNAPAAGIVANQDEPSHEISVAEPDLVSGKEPPWVVRYEQLLERVAGIRRRHPHPRNIGLHDSLPYVIRLGMLAKMTACGCKERKIDRREEGEDEVQQLGRETR